MDKFGPDDDRTKQFCGDSMNESLKGRQRRLDRNKNNKIDAEDFKMLRKGETKEGKEKFPDLTGDGKVTKADILKGRGVNIKEEKPKFFASKANPVLKKHGVTPRLQSLSKSLRPVSQPTSPCWISMPFFSANPAHCLSASRMPEEACCKAA